ncbi:MAG TPA: DUF397 domain-containing protein [Pseudonocardiaceae bacterium]
MSGLTWRKSSYSDAGDDDDDASNCVELALGAVRDSKNPAAAVLSVDVTALVVAVKAGRIG